MDVRRREDSAFAHFENVSGDVLRKAQRRFQMNVERTEVAVVHADDFGAGFERYVQFSFVVHLDERVHPVLRGQFAERPHPVRIQNRGDKEDRVGSVGRGFDYVILGYREVLAQDGERNGVAGFFQIREAALKEVAVGEDGKSAGAALLIMRRYECGIEVLRKNPTARGCLFNFSDDCGLLAAQGLGEIPPSGIRCALFEFGPRNRRIAQLGLLALDDAGQNVGNDCGQRFYCIEVAKAAQGRLNRSPARTSLGAPTVGVGVKPV